MQKKKQKKKSFLRCNSLFVRFGDHIFQLCSPLVYLYFTPMRQSFDKNFIKEKKGITEGEVHS